MRLMLFDSVPTPVDGNEYVRDLALPLPRVYTPVGRRFQALFAAVVAACVIPAADASSARQLVITQADSGKTFLLKVGARAELHLSGKWNWSTPAVRGSAVDLVQINYFRDPGYSGWTIDATSRGAARVGSSGSPACQACSRSARRFAVTIVVRPKGHTG